MFQFPWLSFTSCKAGLEEAHAELILYHPTLLEGSHCVYLDTIESNCLDSFCLTAKVNIVPLTNFIKCIYLASTQVRIWAVYFLSVVLLCDSKRSPFGLRVGRNKYCMPFLQRWDMLTFAFYLHTLFASLQWPHIKFTSPYLLLIQKNKLSKRLFPAVSWKRLSCTA